METSIIFLVSYLTIGFFTTLLVLRYDIFPDEADDRIMFFTFVWPIGLLMVLYAGYKNLLHFVVDRWRGLEDKY